MIENPFTSKTFTNIWVKFFGGHQNTSKFSGIEGIQFIKGNWGIYHNLGKTHTKGMFYSIENPISLQGKTCLIYDVPSYFKCPGPNVPESTTLLKIRQYPGFLIELDQFKDLQDYMRHKFQKSSRYKLNKYQKRLNECFDIKPVMHDAALNLDEFNKIFEKFRSLLVKRFEGKGEHNNNLDIEEWEFYKNVAFPMIQEKKAGLFVVYNDGEPIAITLNYFSGDIIFDAITVFDIDYAKFNLGSINIMFLIQWGIKNGYKILDFSKGYFDYKTRWATKKYDFEYHILYGTKSILSKIKGKSLATLLKLKQYLREKNLNHLLNKIRFAIQPKEKSEPNAINGRTKKFIFKDYDDSNGLPLGKETVVTPETRALLFEFLYLFGENSREVEIYKLKDSDNLFVFMGKNIKKMAVAINDPLPPNYV